MIDFHKRIFNSIKLSFGIFSSLLTPTALAHGISDEQKQRMLEGGYGHYVGLGAEHMLTGYDHLLFLFGVLFFLTTFEILPSSLPFLLSDIASHSFSLPSSKSLGTIILWMPSLR